MSREKVILEVTLDLLSEVGFSGLTVDAVVARAKASKATVYRRWATKEELAIAAFDQLPLIEIKETDNLKDDIIAYVEQYVQFVQTTPLNTVLPALVSEATHNPVLARKLQETVRRRRMSGVEMIRRAMERGELPEQTDPDLVQELIIGPMLQRSFFYPDQLNPQDYAFFVPVILAGLKALGAEASSGAGSSSGQSR